MRRIESRAASDILICAEKDVRSLVIQAIFRKGIKLFSPKLFAGNNNAIVL